MASVYASSFVFILLVTAQFIYARSTTGLSPATEVTFQDGRVTLSLSDVGPGELRRYEVHLKGTPQRFFLYRKPDGTVAALLDACEICGRVGFYQTANGVVCKHCAAPINPQSVGQEGGCNPVPLQATFSDTTVTISEADFAVASTRVKD